MHRALRCRKPLESTVHSAAWSDLKRPKPFIVRSADDVKNPVFWKQLFVLLRALFPLLKLLRLADSNEPNMDKVCFYVEQTRIHLVNSKDALMDEDLFPTSFTITKETEEDANYEDDDEYANSDVEEDEDVTSHDGDYGIDEEEEDVFKVDNQWGVLVSNEGRGIFKAITDAIANRTPKMVHDFAWTAWACSVRPDIVEDVKVRLDGNGPVRMMIEDCVRRLLSNDIDGEFNGEIDNKIDTFWDELKHFQNR